MGSDTSKPVQPPDEWDDQQDHHHPNEFQIISPTSDISNPSEFNHVIRTTHNPRNPRNPRKAGGKGNRRKNRNRNPTGPTPVLDRRRNSGVIAKSMPTDNHSDNSNGRKQNRNDIAEPTGFYFQDKTGARKERTNKENLRIDPNTNNNNGINNNPGDHKHSHPKGLRKVKKLFAKCMPKESQAALEPILEGEVQYTRRQLYASSKPSMDKTKNDDEIHQLVSRNETKHQSKPKKKTAFAEPECQNKPNEAQITNKDERRRSSRDKSKANREHTNNNRTTDAKPKESKQAFDPAAIQNVLFQTQPFVMKEESDNLVMHNKPSYNPIASTPQQTMPDLGMHEEDAYFARLAQGAAESHTKDPRPSPYVVAKDGSMSSYSTLTHEQANLNGAGTPTVHDTPVNNLFAGKNHAAPSPMLGARDEETSVLSVDLYKGMMFQGMPPEKATDEDVADNITKEQPTGAVEEKDTLEDLVNNMAPECIFQDELSSDELDASEADDVLGDLPSDTFHLQDLTSDLDQYLPKKKTSLDSYHEETSNIALEQEENTLKLSELTLGSFSIQQAFRDDSHLQRALSQGNSYSEDDADDASESGSYFKPEESKKFALNQYSNAAPKNPILQIATLQRNSTEQDDTQKRSKLESLFRPILPSMSADDAESLASYDPYLIKVTESAPSLMESKDYRQIAWTAESPNNNAESASNMAGVLALISPSMMSIDSQSATPSSTLKGPVSGEALSNAAFLFHDKYAEGEPELLVKPSERNRNRDSGFFSVSTIATRSYTSAHLKAASIPRKQHEEEAPIIDSNSVRHVHFTSTEPANDVEVPAIESKMSDLTDTYSLASSHHHHQKHSGSGLLDPHDFVPAEDVEDENIETPEDFEDEKSDNDQDNIALAESERVSTVQFKSTDSDGEFHKGTSNLEPNDRSARVSLESNQSGDSQESQDSHNSFHWTYRQEGDHTAATPFSKGKHSHLKPASQATNSPFRRFKAAKTKFNDAKKDVSVVKKKRSPAKQDRNSTGSVVSARIDELNRRVSDMRKLRRKRHSSTGVEQNGSCINPPLIRTPMIMTYKAGLPTAGSFAMHDAYIGTPADVSADVSVEPSINDDGSANEHLQHQQWEEREESCTVSAASIAPSLASSVYDIGRIPEAEVEDGEEYDDDDGDQDNETRMSRDSASSGSTIRQDKEGHLESRFPNHRESFGSVSTASSGFSNLRKNVFRDTGFTAADPAKPSRFSVESSGASTTLSAILHKENSAAFSFRNDANTVKPMQQNQHYYPEATTSPEDLHLSPTQRTPLEARKWRQLAAAAKENDSARKPVGGKNSKQLKPRKGLSERSLNNTAEWSAPRQGLSYMQ